MLSIKLYDRLKHWFWIQPQSDYKLVVTRDRQKPQPQSARRKTAMEVEADLRRIRDIYYLERRHIL
ncbi:hypothetical protein IQ243_22100 [Nostocales cyanobacterium LEGE 11386]|nr:hypothetical protein [Nostocales cyanobacterium LEGE 11386]